MNVEFLLTAFEQHYAFCSMGYYVIQVASATTLYICRGLTSSCLSCITILTSTARCITIYISSVTDCTQLILHHLASLSMALSINSLQILKT